MNNNATRNAVVIMNVFIAIFPLPSPSEFCRFLNQVIIPALWVLVHAKSALAASTAFLPDSAADPSASELVLMNVSS
jgi:hypothetical protein